MLKKLSTIPAQNICHFMSRWLRSSSDKIYKNHISNQCRSHPAIGCRYHVVIVKVLYDTQHGYMRVVGRKSSRRLERVTTMSTNKTNSLIIYDGCHSVFYNNFNKQSTEIKKDAHTISTFMLHGKQRKLLQHKEYKHEILMLTS